MAYLPPVVARLSFDLGDLTAKIDEAKAKIKSLGDTIHIKTDINNDTLKQMAADMEAIHRMMGANQSIRERVNLDDADAKARLEALARDRVANVRVKVNKSDLSQAGGFLDAIKKVFTGGSDINLPFTSMGASPAGLVAIGAGLTALLPELAGVVSGFAAAGAAAGAFGILAYPAVKSVTGAYSALNAAQSKYDAAKAKEALDPTKANATALKSAADNLKLVQDQISKMPASEQMAITGLQKLSTSFHSMSKAFEPQVFSVFNSGLRLMSTLLPTIAPFASTFASSMTKWLTNLNNSAHGSGFQNFIKQFQSISGPALQAITAGIGNVAGSIGRLLTVMSGKDVAHTLNIAFSAISGTIGGLTTTIKFLMNAWDGMGLAAQNVGHSLNSIRGAFDNVRHGLASMGDDILSAFKGIPGSIASIASRMIQPFTGVPGKIKGIFATTGGWLVSAGAGILRGLESGAKAGWSALNGWLGGVPGKIKAAFAGAAGWLLSAGRNIIQGLINGISSMLGPLESIVSKAAGIVKSIAGKLGIHSPSTVTYYYGQMTGEGFNLGLGSTLPHIAQTASTLTGLITGSAASAAGRVPAGGSDQPIHVHVHLDGREITSAVAQRAVQTQRRTGTNGMTKRTR